MPPDRDKDTGQYTSEYTDEDFLAAIKDVSPATTTNIAEAVGCSYNLAYRRLESLYDDGEVIREDIGGTFLWGLS